MQNHQWAGFFSWIEHSNDLELRARKASIMGIMGDLDPKGQAAADARTMLRAIDEAILACTEASLASATLEERKQCYLELLKEFYPRSSAVEIVRGALKRIDAAILDQLNPGSREKT
jgi:hypothetical protein